MWSGWTFGTSSWPFTFANFHETSQSPSLLPTNWIRWCCELLSQSQTSFGKFLGRTFEIAPWNASSCGGWWYGSRQQIRTVEKCPKSTVNLRVVCISLLSTAISCSEFQDPKMHQIRNHIVSAFFKSLYSKAPEIVAVAVKVLSLSLFINKSYRKIFCNMDCVQFWSILLKPKAYFVRTWGLEQSIATFWLLISRPKSERNCWIMLQFGLIKNFLKTSVESHYLKAWTLKLL